MVDEKLKDECTSSKAWVDSLTTELTSHLISPLPHQSFLPPIFESESQDQIGELTTVVDELLDNLKDECTSAKAEVDSLTTELTSHLINRSPFAPLPHQSFLPPIFESESQDQIGELATMVDEKLVLQEFFQNF